MSSVFENMSGPGKPLRAEPPDKKEFEGLVRSGHARLRDALNTTLSIASRFDLSYNAAHALCLAALRWQGYRPTSRYVVFQLLPSTLGLGPDIWRVLDKCHNPLNLGEYAGDLHIHDSISTALVAAVQAVAQSVDHLTPQTTDPE